MRGHNSNSSIIHEAMKRSLATIKLRPKLKHPSKDALPSDELPVAPTTDQAFKRQIMGFREWCEKVYDRRKAVIRFIEEDPE